MNLDGLLTFSEGRHGKSYSYTQLYRTGIIEAVEACLLRTDSSESVEDKINYIPSILYEFELIKSLKQYLSLLQELGVRPPLLILVTFCGVINYRMGVNVSKIFPNNYGIDRDVLNMPEHLLENFDETIEDILRPIFDLIWNACGYSRSFNFDETGKWAGQ